MLLRPYMFTFQTGIHSRLFPVFPGVKAACVEYRSVLPLLLIFAASWNLLWLGLSMCRDALQCCTGSIKADAERSLTVGCTFPRDILAAIPSEETFKGIKKRIIITLHDPKMHPLCMKRLMSKSLTWVTFNATVILCSIITALVSFLLLIHPILFYV